jgi:hypothetical protein
VGLLECTISRGNIQTDMDVFENSKLIWTLKMSARIFVYHETPYTELVHMCMASLKERTTNRQLKGEVVDLCQAKSRGGGSHSGM